MAEVGEVFVISENLHQERGAVKVVALGSQGANDCEEFAVVDIIVPFCS